MDGGTLGLLFGLTAGCFGFFVAGGVVVLALAVTVRGARLAADHQDLLRTGSRARAKILEVNGGAPIENRGIAARVTLEVTPPDGAPSFTTVVDHVFGAFDIPKIQPGRQLEVRYDPMRTDRIVIIKPLTRAKSH